MTSISYELIRRSWFDQGQGTSWEQRFNDTLPVDVFLK